MRRKKKQGQDNLPKRPKEKTKEEGEDFEVWFKKEEERQAREREAGQIRVAQKEAEEKQKRARYPFQNFLIFIITGFCAILFISFANLTDNDIVGLGSVAVYTILLFILRSRLRWRLWSPVIISMVLLIGYVLFEFVRVVIL